MTDEIKFKVTIDKTKHFYEFMDMANDLIELCEFIPDWQQPEAQPIAQRMADRLMGWLSVQDKKG